MKGEKQPMRRGAKPGKSKVASDPAPRRPAPTNDASSHRRLEQRLAEALEQQAATAEILRVISSSPHDAQPVFEAIVGSAARLCEAEFSAVARFEDGLLHLAAISNMSPAETAAYQSLFPRPPHRGFIIGRAFVDGRPVHVEDVREDPDYDPHTLEVLQHAAPYRSYLGVPILRNGVPIGAIGCGRRDVRPFTATQIELVKTFADQAVIAIENVRLFKELEARNRDLTETLEQQTATGEILRVISGSPTDIQPVFDAIAESVARLCESFDAVIYRRDGDRLVLAAHHGPIAIGRVGDFSFPIHGSVAGRAVLDQRAAHVGDVQAEASSFPVSSGHARDFEFRTILSVPLMREGSAIGAISLRRTDVQLFTVRQIALLQTFADQAVIAIENVRLFTELGARNRDLTETLEQQTATSEILRVISSSPTDVQPVFDTIVANAVSLCGARMGAVYRFDGELVHLVAHHNYPPAVLEVLQRMYPRPPRPDQASGRAILTSAVAQIEDMLADPSYPREIALAGGWRSILAVPMLRDAVPVGAIVITRNEAGPFSDGHIELLKTFADQAVIALQNVRLFKELEARNRDLTDTLEQQTATSEILSVISSSPTDVQPVFDTIASNARRLCNADSGSVFTYDGTLVHLLIPRQHQSRAQRCPARGVPAGADARDGGGASAPHPSTRPHLRRAGRPHLRPPDPAGRGAAQRAERAHAPRWTPRRHHHRPHVGDASPVHPHPDRSPEDLRRSGRHRDPERAPLHGARGAQ